MKTAKCVSFPCPCFTCPYHRLKKQSQQSSYRSHSSAPDCPSQLSLPAVSYNNWARPPNTTIIDYAISNLNVVVYIGLFVSFIGVLLTVLISMIACILDCRRRRTIRDANPVKQQQNAYPPAPPAQFGASPRGHVVSQGHAGSACCRGSAGDI